jgi:putative transposase
MRAILCQCLKERLELGESIARGKRYQSGQVVNLLRQIEVAIANEKTPPQACKEAAISEQTYFR